MSTSDDQRPVIVEINVEARPTTGTYEIPRAEWDAMTPAQRRRHLDDMVGEEIGNAGGAGWYIADPDDEAAASAEPGNRTTPAASADGTVPGNRTTPADVSEPVRDAQVNHPAGAPAAMRSAAQYAAAVEALLRRPRVYRTSDAPPPGDVRAVSNGADVWQRIPGEQWVRRPDPEVPLTDEQIMQTPQYARRRVWADLAPLLVADATQPVDWGRRDGMLPDGVRGELADQLAGLAATLTAGDVPARPADAGGKADGTRSGG